MSDFFRIFQTCRLQKQNKKIVDDFKVLERKSYNSDFEIYKAFEGINLETILMFATVNPEITGRYIDKLRHIKPEITGKDLQGIGIAPSPKYSEIFDFILSEKLKNPALNKTQEIELVKNFYLIP